MKTYFVLAALAAVWSAALTLAQAPASVTTASQDTRLFEMRTYYAAPGKLDELQARFRDHTVKLFEQHGMQNLGYWAPVDNSDNRLIYILAYPSREARELSWKQFSADPDWQKVQKSSEANGRLVAKAESIFMKATDYSPAIKPVASGPARLFELRTYTAAPGKLSNLNKRFRDHTLALFAKHGIVNVAYWVPTEPGKGAEDTLIYLIAHKDQAAADASWKAFRADPEWTTAKTASEVNGPLTTTGGVKSIYMTPTDYSPTR
jgi:hypothetical protein